MKNIITSLIITTCICLVVGLLAFYLVGLYEQALVDRCTCLGQRPYISTKWNGSCVTLVLDVEDYNGEGMVQYLFNAMEECR